MKSAKYGLLSILLGFPLIWLQLWTKKIAQIDLSTELFQFRTPEGFEHATIPSVMERFKVPGLSLALIENFEIPWSGSLGFASKREGRLASADTLFQAGSISKFMTALTVLRLVSQSVFHLDDKIDPLLSGWSLKEAGEMAQGLTVRSCLQMNSGLDTPGFMGYFSGEPLPHLVQILKGEPPARNVEVKMDRLRSGSYSYSGGGYEVLRFLLESVSGVHLNELAVKELFQPLGMRESYFLQPLPEMLAKNAAEAHDGDGEPFKDPWRIYPELAAAGLWSTAYDIALSLVALAKSVSKGRSGFLNPHTLSALFQPMSRTGYSLGFVLGGAGKGMHLMKLGQNSGFQRWLILFPITGQGMVVMGNSDRGRELSEAIIQAVARKRHWPEGFELRDAWRLTP